MSDSTSAADRARQAATAIGLIDLTDLNHDHSRAGIDALCERAVDQGTAAVCVWPEFVVHCARRLEDTPVAVATVVNFPKGTGSAHAVLDEALYAVADGANEIDLVLPYKNLLDGDIDGVAKLVGTVGDIVEPPGILKVILETSELDANAIKQASALAIESGADFLKTSTGFTDVGATLDAVRIMLDVIAVAPRQVGIKPSGGIRTFDDAMGYLELAAEVMGPEWISPATFRFGASGLLDSLLEVVNDERGGGA